MVQLRPLDQNLLQPLLNQHQLGLEHHIRHASSTICDRSGRIQGLLGAVGEADGYGFEKGCFSNSMFSDEILGNATFSNTTTMRNATAGWLWGFGLLGGAF